MTWFLPWERWIPEIVPKKIVGPYLLYYGFAIWHFKQSWWIVLLLGLMGIAVCAAAIFDLRKAGMLKQAQREKREYWNRREAKAAIQMGYGK